MGILIAVLSLIPGDDLPDVSIEFVDLIVHVLMYGTWIFVLCLEIEKQYSGDSQRFRLRMLFIVIIFGIIIEVLQELFIPGRFGSVSDVLANAFGAILMYIGFNKMR